MTGRGAFTSIGIGNGSAYYEYIPGKPVTGSERSKGHSYEAVFFGSRAIQQAINDLGYSSPLVTDGLFGPKSADAVKWVQQRMGGKPDGKAGPGTCAYLWRPYVKKYADVAGIDPKYLYGQLLQESNGDAGAEGTQHEADRGLIQINTDTYTNISPEQAHDPNFALKWSALRLAAARVKYAGKGADIQTNAMILQHNSPSGADYLFSHGTYKTLDNEAYVTNTLKNAAKY